MMHLQEPGTQKSNGFYNCASYGCVSENIGQCIRIKDSSVTNIIIVLKETRDAHCVSFLTFWQHEKEPLLTS